MLLQLGEATFDVSTRALVAAHVADDGTGDDAVMASAVAQADAGADVLIVPGEGDQLVDRVRQIRSLGVPLWISSPDAVITEQCARTGASIVTIAEPGQLLTLAERLVAVPVTFAIDHTSGSVSALPSGMAAASVIGYSSNATDGCGSQLADSIRAVTAASAGAQVVAAMAGVRIIVCDNVRAARRTLDTISVLLQRRGHVTPTAVMVQGAR